MTNLLGGELGYWPFIEASGDTARDYSGHKLHLTLVGSASWSESDLPDLPGIDNFACLDLPGENASGAQIVAPGLDLNTDYCVSMWVCPRTLPQLGTFVSTGGNLTGNSNVTWIGLGNLHLTESAKYLSFREYSPLALDQLRRTGFTEMGDLFSAGEWSHVVAASSSAQYSVYVDGYLAGTRNIAKPTFNPPSRLTIGHFPDFTRDVTFDGRIADVRFFGRLLTLREIKRLAAGRVSPAGGFPLSRLVN